jgi:hypothetical protein|tara:strand:+ start:8642 stop:8902 length:261 start_codon:yes stop_codon:yes gene_type:complete
MNINEEHYFYLDALQDSGEINMFEAPRHLRDEFGLSKQESYAIFSAWSNDKAEEVEDDEDKEARDYENGKADYLYDNYVAEQLENK